MYGAYELGATPAGKKRRKHHPKKITKARYETMVKRHAMRIATKRAKVTPTPADYAAAKIAVDAKLKKRNITVAGDHLVGLSDIMGAAFLVSAAEAGNPVAKKAIRNTALKAKTGNPTAVRNAKALRAVAQGRKINATKRSGGGGLLSRWFRAVDTLNA